MNYRSRMIAENVSRHIVTPLPMPSRDVLASTVYSQTWQYHDGTNLISFHVLALDADMAKTLGEFRLAAMGNDPRVFLLARNLAVPSASVDRVVAVVLAEDFQERNWRERAFQQPAEVRR